MLYSTAKASNDIPVGYGGMSFLKYRRSRAHVGRIWRLGDLSFFRIVSDIPGFSDSCQCSIQNMVAYSTTGSSMMWATVFPESSADGLLAMHSMQALSISR